MLEWLIKFQKMDRRWVFLGMALAILIPLLVPIKLPFRWIKKSGISTSRSKHSRRKCCADLSRL